jgi:hypothetical protein
VFFRVAAVSAERFFFAADFFDAFFASARKTHLPSMWQGQTLFVGMGPSRSINSSPTMPRAAGPRVFRIRNFAPPIFPSLSVAFRRFPSPLLASPSF